MSDKSLTSISVICEFEYRSVHESRSKNLHSRIRLTTKTVWGQDAGNDWT